MQQSIRADLHKAIDRIEDEAILKALYTLLAKEIAHEEFDLTDAQKAELDRRYELHKQGKSKSYTWEEVKQLVREGNK